MADPAPENWGEYRRLVLAELERLTGSVASLQKEVHACRVEIATLKAKASVWGAVGGTVPAIVAIIISILRG